MGVRAEVARAEGRPLAGFSADLWKFFDLVNPQAAIRLLETVGLDEGVGRALRSFYDELGRVMTLNGIAGKKWFAHQSVLQGCAWSKARCGLATWRTAPEWLRTPTRMTGMCWRIASR